MHNITFEPRPKIKLRHRYLLSHTHVMPSNRQLKRSLPLTYWTVALGIILFTCAVAAFGLPAGAEWQQIPVKPQISTEAERYKILMNSLVALGIFLAIFYAVISDRLDRFALNLVRTIGQHLRRK